MNKTVFEHNIAALQKKNPVLAEQVLSASVSQEYQVVMSKNGLPVLKINRISLHSLYDPEKEGRSFLQAHLAKQSVQPGDTVCIFGLGFGYHVRPFTELPNRVVVLEPRLDVLRCAFEQIDMAGLIEAITICCDVSELQRAPEVLFAHQPTVKVNQSVFKQLTEKENCSSASNTTSLDSTVSKKKIRILIVSPIYGGSLPVTRYCTDALKELGHEVQLLDASMFNEPFQKVLGMKIDTNSTRVLNDLFLHLISEMVVGTCLDYAPDMVLALSQAPLSPQALQRLNELNITTAFWFVEDYKYMPYWKQYAPLYDFYFTIQDDRFFDELRDIGVQNYCYLPMAADPGVHNETNLSQEDMQEFGSDISFMGAGYYNRQKMFHGLLDFDFKIWGNEWDMRSPVWQHVQRSGARISTDDTVKIFNASKININLHSSVSHEGVNPQGDFVNPRTYELASCGAFQLVDERSILNRHFAVGEEIITYKDLEDLRAKIEYFLTHDDERLAIAQRAKKRVMQEHTYKHRMEHMLSFIQQRKPDCFYQKSAPSSPVIHDVEAFYTKHPETTSILSDALRRTQGAPNIDTVAAAIHAKQGPIEYPEALFLLIKEYEQLLQEHR